MKTKKIKRLSIVMSLLLLFNSLGMFAADTVVQDEIIDSSLTENVENSVYASSNVQARLGEYYSDYNDAGFYDSTSELQNRANCYGYAFRMFYALDSYPSGNNYKQQPGEFAVKTTPIQLQLSSTETHSISSYYDILTLNGKLFSYSTYSLYSISYKFNAILSLVNADAAALGYTLTEYTGTTIPDATLNTNKRLIALVVGPRDYHFYMQHSDNTWSHKLADEVPQDYCISCEEPLTNDNIRTHACEGSNYANGIVKFYYITKNAVVDYKHTNGAVASSVRTRLISTDLAGNTFYAAKDIGDLPDDYVAGALDYPGDTDYYEIYTSATETRTLTVDTPSDYRIQIRVHKSDGSLYVWNSNISSATITVDLEIDTLYYVAITAIGFDTYEYDVSYTWG